MMAKRHLIGVILVTTLLALAGQWTATPARADEEKALHIYDLARQLHSEDIDNGNYTAWVNGNMGHDETGRPGKLDVGQAMPDFQFKYFDRDGQITRKALKGPYILNFWASWCPPCRDEFPLLVENIENDGLTVPVYFVNVYDRKADAQRFLANMQLKATILVDEPKTSFAEKYGLHAIPQTILVDAEGNVQAIHSGGMTDYSIEFFNEIANNPGISAFDASDPDQPPENMVTEAGKSTLSRAN